jgi:4-amino-4-deoxy-L-arabinose transferase-like glycosyltransferase
MNAFRRIPEALAAAAADVPKAGWLCTLVATMGGIAWALLVPPFHVPDEPAHFAYTQYLAEAGQVPTNRDGARAYSEEELRALDALRYKQVEVRPDNRPLTNARAQRQLERTLETRYVRRSEGGYSHANGNPPLYYAIELAPYWAVSSGNLLDRLFAMRLLSALLGGLTVLFAFHFLRELLPGTPWAWTVGALAVALQPVFGNISGAVHGDNLLYAASAGVFLMLAICFRRGVTAPRGAALGLAAAAGILAKPTMLGLVPGIAVGLLLLVARADRDGRDAAIRGAAAAVLCAALPVIAYGLVNLGVWDRGFYLGSAETEQGAAPPAAAAGAMAKTLGGYLDYLWQFYLPRLPFMEAQFDEYPLVHIWFDGFVGRFGALEYGFGTAVDAVAVCVYGAVFVLAARELVRQRSRIGSRIPELLTYAALAAGLLLFVHKAGYDARSPEIQGFEQARYLFPMLTLYAAIIALAARGAGRRFGPAAGVLIVSLAVAHTLLAYLLTLTRYYG